MAPHLEEFDIPDLNLLLMGKEIPQASGKSRVSKQTSPCRRGKIIYPIPFCQFKLAFTGTPLNIQEPPPVNLPLLFRTRFRQELGTKGTENESFATGVSGDELKDLLILGHWALSQHLTGKYEFEVLPFEEIPGSLQHQDVTIDTGVHIPSIPVSRILNQLEVFLGNIDDPKGNFQPDRRPLGLLKTEKRGFKTDGQDLNPLILQKACCQYAIQSAR